MFHQEIARRVGTVNFEALRRSAEIDARRIQVEVEDTEVKLYGSVRSWAEKEEAEGAAWSAPGTTKVESFIVVNP